MTTETPSSRNKSQRLIDKKQKQQLDMKEKVNIKNNNNSVKVIPNPVISDICFGLNELTDSLHALPQDIVSYFTLLKEIEAKCVYTVPHLQAYIKRFLTMRKNHPKRGLLLSRIRECIREIMPCLEEKMHVATIASDNVKKYITKLDQAYEIVIEKEIPESIRIGPLWEPCMKVSEPKSLQQQRSESRREALAAKKARNGGGGGNMSAFEDDYEGTAAEDSVGPTVTKKKSKKEKSNSNNNHNNNNNYNGGNNSTFINSNISSTANGSGSKKRKNNADDENTNVGHSSNNSNGNGTTKKSKSSKVKKESKKEIEGHTSKSGASNNGHNNGANGNGDMKNNNGGSKSRSSTKGGDDGTGSVNTASNTAFTTTTSSSSSKSKKETASNKESKIPTSPINYEGEPVYCYCQQVSYGEMVGCDGENCEKEWFHLPCTGLKELPKGEWYCDDCKANMTVGR